MKSWYGKHYSQEKKLSYLMYSMMSLCLRWNLEWLWPDPENQIKPVTFGVAQAAQGAKVSFRYSLQLPPGVKWLRISLVAVRP